MEHVESVRVECGDMLVAVWMQNSELIDTSVKVARQERQCTMKQDGNELDSSQRTSHQTSFIGVQCFARTTVKEIDGDHQGKVGGAHLRNILSSC